MSEQRSEARMHAHVGVFVIVEPRAAQLLVRQVKAERPNQMQTCAGIGAQTNDIAGIRRNFRLDQNDVEHRLSRQLRECVRRPD